MNRNRYEVSYCRVHDYVTSELEGAATASQRREFAALLASDESVRQIYVAYMQEQTSLRWSYANQPLDLLDEAMNEAMHGAFASRAATAERRPGGRDRVLPWAALLGFSAAAIIAGVGVWFATGGDRPHADRLAAAGDAAPVATAAGVVRQVNQDGGPVQPGIAAVATVTRMIDVRWAADSISPAELSRLRPGQTLDLMAGQVELLFDTGVEVVLEGQTHFKILTAGSAYSQHGSIGARVGEEARGFTIETPSARVIDLGTEFGVTISELGETEVAVFRGIVDLTLDGSESRAVSSITKRLNQGEALRVGSNGEFHRVFAVPSDRFPTSSPDHRLRSTVSPLISDVRDNIRDSDSKKFYKIVRGGLHEDAPAFVDRNHQWNGVDDRGIPRQLRGAEYIMPFNDDKQLRNRLEVTLYVAKPITLFVFLSDAVTIPQWLHEGGFVDTGDDIGLDEGPSRWHPTSTGRRHLATGEGKSVDTVFSIWKREVKVPSEVVLGGVERPTDIDGFNMYGIAATPLY
ncbi:FecR protein [Pirellulimonas nuda]|uniref:FecR protein n=1 Tax=Pirellulimonas nuda TaxID=2528009 RepID=A0A518DIY8_9BACT|nr:FecR family protein [Pirellulimonas nuda]QDU91440.1 FecR protein [Pirellulimonas nuda]